MSECFVSLKVYVIPYSRLKYNQFFVSSTFLDFLLNGFQAGGCLLFLLSHLSPLGDSLVG